MATRSESSLIEPRAVARRTHGGLLILACCAALAIGMAVLLLCMTPSTGPRAKAVRVRLPLPAVILPPSDPAVLRPLTPDQALKWNAATPLSTLPNPPAVPFNADVRDTVDFPRSLDCLTAAVYYEAASETDDGERAVAQVVLNRLRHPAFPHTVCGVVFEGHERPTGCQFTFSCDGALSRQVSKAGWDRARAIAERALKGEVYKPVGWATHYHTEQVVPYWSSTLVKTAQVGAHIFYRWEGGWGTRRAFAARYVGVEPNLSFPFGLRVVGPKMVDGLPIATGPVLAVTRDERPVLGKAAGRGIADPTVAGPQRDVSAVERPVLGSAGSTGAGAVDSR